MADLGFLTLETEDDQLAFVDRILAMTEDRQAVFLDLMRKKQASPEYAANVKEFDAEFNGKVVPMMKKIITDETRKAEEAEKSGIDEAMEKIINDN